MIKKDLTEMCDTLYMDELVEWIDENQYDYVLVRKDELEALENYVEEEGVDN